MRIDLDPAAIVERDAGFLQAEALGVGHGGRCDQNHIGFERLGRSARGRLDGHLQPLFPDVSTPVTLVPSLNAKPCFFEDALELLATSPSMPGRIRSRNSTTVTFAPSRRQTEPSSSPITPAPMTSRGSRHLVQRQRAGRRHDALLVDLDALQPRDIGAGGDDDVLGLDRLRLAVLPVTSTLPAPSLPARR